MDRSHGLKRTGNGPPSLISVAGAGQFSHTSVLGSRVEVTEDASKHGSSGILGYVNSGLSPTHPHETRPLTLEPPFYRSGASKKKKQIIIPLIDNNFDSSDPSASSAAPKEPYIPKELREDPTEVVPAATPAAPPRKDPFAGGYGLLTKDQSSTKSNASSTKAPLLARSRPKGWRDIEDEGEKLKYEMDARPEADSSCYDRVAIEDFGRAMLLGMGWSGDINEGPKVIEYVSRPERLGLGATPMAPPPGAKGASAKPHMEYRDENGIVRHVKPIDAALTVVSKFFADGTKVSIVSGPHAGMNGRIRRLSSDEKEYIVDLENDEQVRTRLRDCELYNASKKRPAADPRDLEDSRPDKRYKAAEVVVDHRERDAYRRDERPREEKKVSLWVTPYIRVKVSSKRYRDGKYYCKKGVIEDVISGTRCAVRLDDGYVLDDIDQSDLETVIPAVGGRIMVVRGPDTGVRGVMREKDFSKEVVYIQIEDELDVLRFNMDDVSEYVE